jgi:hypothetical protein
MASRRKRVFHHASEYLSTLGAFRLELTTYQGQMPIGADLYRRTDILRKALDDVVEVLTGDRTHFWLKGNAPHRPPNT